MNIAILGAGYTGFTIGNCFAKFGHNITFFDTDRQKLQDYQSGKLNIFEPSLDELFHANLESNLLTFTTDLASALPKVDLVFITLPTNSLPDGSVDLSLIFNLTTHLKNLPPKPLIIKSTVPPGTNKKLTELLPNFEVISNPEFLSEGNAIKDFLQPDRIIIGHRTSEAKTLMNQLYAPLLATHPSTKLIFMSPEAAEMSKYGSNFYFAMRISYINEINNLCQLLGVDIDEVREGIGTDHRIGEHYLRPGLAYGGSCLPKDTHGLLKFSESQNYDFKLLKSTIEVNDRQHQIFLNTIKQALQSDQTLNANPLNGKTIGILGLTFKSGTDDVRQSPALHLIKDLIEAGAKIKAHDPKGQQNFAIAINQLLENPTQAIQQLSYHNDPYAIAENADLVMILTEWPSFRELSLDKLKSFMRTPTSNNPQILDPKNFLKA